jgi:hypothetical protein
MEWVIHGGDYKANLASLSESDFKRLIQGELL